MPGAEAVLATAPIAGLAAYVLVHVFFSRALSRPRFLAYLLLAFLAGGVLTGLLSAVALRDLQGGVVDAIALSLLNALTYAALGFCYFNFVNSNLTSLRIRLLRELLERQPHGIGRGEIFKKYGAKEILSVRLDRLTGSGHLVCREDRYYTGKRGILLIARTFDFLNWLVPGRKMSKAGNRGSTP